MYNIMGAERILSKIKYCYVTFSLPLPTEHLIRGSIRKLHCI